MAFETLNKINVNEHTEKKGKFTYLSWAWAWSIFCEHYPEASFEILPDVTFPDGTMEVRVQVCAGGLIRTMWLPVMDNRNSAIQNPHARDVNDARMRCLVKCLALFGLGLYIYAGEDIPDVEQKPSNNQSSEKPPYNDFASHKEMMLAGIQSGEKTPDSIIKNLEQKYKLSKKVKDEIKALRN